jgi:hypothetical protein
MIAKTRRLPEKSGGFTLVELIVVMTIFMTVMIITSYAFTSILNYAGGVSKSAETQIEGIVGLEILRSDIEQAGYGLPWAFQRTTVGYEEADSTECVPRFTKCDAKLFNDAGDETAVPPKLPQVPRAIMSGDNIGYNGSDYLVIKSMVIGRDPTAKKWTYLNYAEVGNTAKEWGSGDDLVKNDRVVVIRTTFPKTFSGEDRQLIVSASTTGSPAANFFTKYDSPIAMDFRPQSSTDTYLVYGVDSDSNLRMPFNRADFYINRPGHMPATCAPNTGILYKGVVQHRNKNGEKGGGISQNPLLDCVADMQVVYTLDTTGNGGIYHTDNIFDGAAPDFTLNAKEIRQQVKEVRVYILAQEGKFDRAYTYPAQIVTVGAPDIGGHGSAFDLKKKIGSGWQHYRWKLYTIVVNPKNLY